MDQIADKGRRIAFFGGSFDPPHLGHLAVARAAWAALHLDQVLFAPVGAQPLKPLGSTAPFEDRVAMTRLAVAGEAGFDVSLVDAPKPGGAPNYTLETLERLRARLGAGGELFFLMGADSFFSLRQWHRAAEIPFVASLVVAARPGQNLEGLRAALPAGITIEATKSEEGADLLSYGLRNAAGERASLYLLPQLQVEISASEVREQIRKHRTSLDSSTIDQTLLPQAVFEYIQSHGLYR